MRVVGGGGGVAAVWWEGSGGWGCFCSVLRFGAKANKAWKRRYEAAHDLNCGGVFVWGGLEGAEFGQCAGQFGVRSYEIVELSAPSSPLGGVPGRVKPFFALLCEPVLVFYWYVCEWSSETPPGLMWLILAACVTQTVRQIGPRCVI